jgi:NADPH-dependent 2,4-dienoyl-CoA reductase/sulfur reductase-like enzyme
MKKTDVLIIGGSAAGITTALTVKMKNPEKKVTLVRKEKKVMVPCGIPYIFGTIGTTEKNILPDGGLLNAGIEIIIGEAVNIDLDQKCCTLGDDKEICYDKLIFATGSTPVRPSWLNGNSLENVFTILKNKDYLDELQKKLRDMKNIVVVGAGFIGVEVTDELNKAGKHVTLVEKLPHILGMAFDPEFADKGKEILESRGIDIIAGKGIKEIIGNGSVSGIVLEDGQKMDADAVVLAMGYVPNSQLALKSGLKLNEKGFIKVDEYLRTNEQDVFAVGDCAEKKDFFTRKTSTTMLASTACGEARVIGLNLYKLSTPKSFGGTIAIYSTVIGDTAFATAGLTETMARKENYDIVTGVFEGPDKHPGALPGMHKQFVKLIASKDTRTILGGEVMGGYSSGELINVIGLAIENKMTLSSLLISQIGTHPMLTGSPVGYPLIKAAEMACRPHEN